MLGRRWCTLIRVLVEDGALSLQCWVEDGALSLQCLIFCTVDTLHFDAGECTICLDDMAAGENV